MTLNTPSWLPFALGAAVVLVGALILSNAASTPNSGQLIVPEAGSWVGTIG